MIYLHVFIIHEKTLVYREKFLTNALKTLENVCKNKNYIFCSYEISTDDEVDNKELSKEQRSNFSKQRTAIKKIVELGKCATSADTHYYMCVEDDCVFLSQFIENLEVVMGRLNSELWDILFLSVCELNKPEGYIFKETREFFKIIPSKECYLINVPTATKLLPSLEKMHKSYRLQLSEWIYDNSEIFSKFSPKRVSIEGSKVGIVPSSVNDTNTLVYNKDYLALLNMLNNVRIDEAEKIFQLSAHLKSPDIIHLYAVLMFKSGRMSEAKELFLEAVDETLYKNGKLDKGTEILNNAINIFGIHQTDRDIYRKEPSKYAKKMI